jgi:hypothetical protein
MNIQDQIARNRKPLPQIGQKVETPTAWCLRYYTNEVYTHGKSAGKRKQRLVTLAPKTDHYRSWQDVEPLIAEGLEEINGGRTALSARPTFAESIETEYLPWAAKNKAATSNAYTRVWVNYRKPCIAANLKLTTVQITRILTACAEGVKVLSLCHILSGSCRTFTFTRFPWG